MTKDEMIEWFKSAPMGSRHERMLWAARKIARLTGDDNKGTAGTIQFDANDVIIITAPLRLSKKLHSLPSSLGRIIQSRGRSCVDPWPSRREMDGHSLPVSALINACRLELIASRMQSVISTMS